MFWWSNLKLNYHVSYGVNKGTITNSNSCFSEASGNGFHSVPKLKAAVNNSSHHPPPIPPRKPSRQLVNGGSTRLTTASSEQSLSGITGRPATSASNSSFTPNYITPSQSPCHGIQLEKFYCIPELEFDKSALPPVRIRSAVRRTIHLARQSNGEFGFSLRCASAIRRVRAFRKDLSEVKQ